jgi:zinc transport system ATP-binding protein
VRVTVAVLELADGVVGYDARPVLRGVSLTVRAGEVVAILGANGSGKSTLIRAALGLVPMSAGTVRLFGTPVRRFRQRHRLGYVPQRLGAGSGVPATVGEVVTSGRLARRGWRHRPGPDQAVARAIAAVGLTGRTDDPVGTLSGGQQQRTLIARALAGEPELLVLDEPTAGVDAASQAAFLDALRRFVAAGGTVLLVAHELGPLEAVVSRAVVLHQGRVVHDGAVPPPAGHHADPAHDHVHPHAPAPSPGMWGVGH